MLFGSPADALPTSVRDERAKHPAKRSTQRVWHGDQLTPGAIVLKK